MSSDLKCACTGYFEQQWFIIYLYSTISMKLEFSDAILLFLYCKGTYQHTFKSASHDAFLKLFFDKILENKTDHFTWQRLS